VTSADAANISGKAPDLGHRAEIPFTDHLGRKSIFDAIGIANHTDHRSPHRQISNPVST